MQINMYECYVSTVILNNLRQCLETLHLIISFYWIYNMKEPVNVKSKKTDKGHKLTSWGMT